MVQPTSPQSEHLTKGVGDEHLFSSETCSPLFPSYKYLENQNKFVTCHSEFHRSNLNITVFTLHQNLSLCFIKLYTLRPYVGAEVQFHTLTSESDSCEWSASPSNHFTSGGWAPGTLCKGCRVGLRSCLNSVEKILCPERNHTPISPVIQPAA